MSNTDDAACSTPVPRSLGEPSTSAGDKAPEDATTATQAENTSSGKNDGLEKKVGEWLNRSGFPFEMRVAEVFRKSQSFKGWITQANVPYVDPKSGQLRETDLEAFVFAENRDESEISIGFELLVECKATSTPWVILVSKFTEEEPPLFSSMGRRTCAAGLSSDQLLMNLVRQDFGKFMKDKQVRSPAAGYSIVEAFKERGNKEATYAATQQVLSMLNAKIATLLADESSEAESVGMIFLLPVIVTTSPLFEATLDLESSQVVTRRVDRGAVRIAQSAARGVEVVIANESALPGLADSIGKYPLLAQKFLDGYDRAALRDRAQTWRNATN